MTDQVEFRKGVIRPVDCYREAWEIIKPHYWILFALTIVGVMISGATFYLLGGAMICGIMFSFLAVVEGEEPKFENLFKGFEFWRPGLFVFAVMVLPTIFVMALTYFPVIVAALMGQTMNDEELYAFLAGVFAVESLFLIVMVCIHTLLIFSFPLIVDRRMSGWASMKLSARGAWANLQGVAGLWVVGFFVSLAGLLLFCVGVYFTVPIIIAAHLVAYRKIFPAENMEARSYS